MLRGRVGIDPCCFRQLDRRLIHCLGELGLADWGWEQVEPYFRKVENAVDRPESQSRGHDGELQSEQESVTSSRHSC